MVCSWVKKSYLILGYINEFHYACFKRGVGAWLLRVHWGKIRRRFHPFMLETSWGIKGNGL